jgi:Leucine-rich repeat (LRR) protein/membrane-associated phospholipid phosphatase
MPLPLPQRSAVTSSRVRVRRGWLLSFSILALAILALSILAGASPSIGVEPSSPGSFSRDWSIDTRDGLVTATFSDRTDDDAIAAAVPQLIRRGVQSIVLRGAPVRDLGPLAGISGLKMLDISGTQVRNLAPLAGLTGLRSLDLQFLRVSDLRPLARLTGLQTLNLGGTEVRDLRPIGGLISLQQLTASVTKVRDLAPIARLRELTALNLDSTWVADISPLADMTNLVFLSLNGTSVDDLQPLVRLISLRTLDLGGTQISDVGALSGLHELRSLNLESTFVADVRPLAGLTALDSVSVGGSPVHDITPLARLSLAAAQPGPTGEDPVLAWNELTNRSIQATATDAFEAPRALAMESIAVLDTIRSIAGTPAFLVRLAAPRGVSVNVAVAAAAHQVLVHLFPSRHAVLDGALAASLMHEPANPALAQAISFGEAVADAVLMLRGADGVMAMGISRAGIAPGEWRPTPPDFLPAAHSQWATMQPFALNRPDQFRPAGPPQPGTEAFRQARAVVASLGEARSATRTAEQTGIAQYWSDAAGTYAPAGHWNAIAANAVASLRLGVAVEAELFAELNVAMADAGIAMADAKYAFWSWRPVTAIRAGDDAARAAPDWTPLLNTPNHPSYISGHSSFSGAAATVLTMWFGTHPFSFASMSLPSVTRHFANFQQAAEEAAMSRVYGGIHFPFDNADGLATGRAVGAWTMRVFRLIAEDRGPVIVMMDHSIAATSPAITTTGPDDNLDQHDVIGCALDNLAPVTSVTVRLDGGEPFNIQVDGRGLFTLAAERLGASRRHAATLTATSVTGRSLTLQVPVD